MKKTIYSITVTKWNEHNGKKRKIHSYIMLSTGFLNDAKIRSLSPVNRLLYLSCLLLAGESSQSQFEVSHESLSFQSGVKSGSLQSQLDLLQSLQLVSYSKIEPLIKRKGKEEKGKERKLNEDTLVPAVAETPPEKSVEKKLPEKKPEASGTREVIALYCDEWKLSYKDSKSSPTIMPKDAGSLGRLVKSVGTERAKDLVRSYLQMPDQWYLTKRHDIPTLMNNLNAIGLFLDSGKMITRSEIKRVEQRTDTENLLRHIEENGI